MKLVTGEALPGAVKKNLRTGGEGVFLDPNKKAALGFSLRPQRLKNL